MAASSSATPPSRYSAAAIALHWGLAALLLFQLSLGWRLEELPIGLSRFTAFQLHKSVGIAILLLSALRLAIRFMAARPAPAAGGAAVQALVRLTHAGLYAVMIGGPLTGWVLVSTARVKMQTMLFGLVPWPSLPVPSALNEPAEALHGLLAWLLAGLIALHVAGALRHHLAREDLLGRMMPRVVPSSHGALTLAAIVAVLVLGGAFGAAWLWQLPAIQPAGAPASAPTVAPVAAPASEAVALPAETPSEAASDIPGQAPSDDAVTEWTLEKGGKLGFNAQYGDTAITGSFHRWNADIRFSPDNLADSHIRVTIDLASADTADAERDNMLRSASFFDVAAHPQAVFTSSAIRAKGGKAYVANGTLSLHGQRRPLSLNFTVDIADDRASAKGFASLRRTQFNVGSGEWANTDQISDAVAINFALKARAAKARKTEAGKTED